MTRKLLAGAAGIAIIAALAVVPAWASQGAARGSVVGGDGQMESLAAARVPEAVRTAPESAAVKPARPAPNGAAPGLEPGRPAKPAAGGGKVAAKLAGEMEKASSGAETFEVLVTTAVDPAQVMARLGGLEASHTYRQSMLGFAARLTAAQIRQLQAMPEVESLGADEEVHITIDSAARWTGATKARNDFGLTGDGDGFEQRYSSRDVVIAVVDTGIDATHADLRAKVIGWKDMVNDEPAPYDDHGHGTHVAGIAAGAGATSPAMQGVAPGAALVGVKVLSASGGGSFSGVIGGIEWVVENRERYNIRVMKRELM